MARTKNIQWKPPLGYSYQLVVYGKLNKNESNISKLHGTNQEFIKWLLNKLIDRAVSIITWYWNIKLGNEQNCII